MSRWTFLLPAALSLSFLCPSLPAQEGTELPSGRGKATVSKPQEEREKKPVEDLEAKARKLREEAIRNPGLADPKLLVEIYRDALRFWPRGKEGQTAVDQLVKGGKGVCPLLLALLKERDFRLKPGAAEVLARLGCVEAAESIEELLQDPRLQGSYRLLLAALYRLDRPRAEQHCLQYLRGTSGAFRQAAYHVLNQHVPREGMEPETLEGLRGLLSSEVDDARYKAFLLLEKVRDAELDRLAVARVGDPYPPLARRVTAYLSGRNTPEVKAALRERVTFDHSRGFAFALVILVRMERTFGEPLLDPAWAVRLEPFLQSRDPVLSVGAAAAYTRLALRSGAEDARNRVREQVVPLLMQVFLTRNYFRDFTVMLDCASETLKEATGAPFGTDLTFWRSWWKKEGAAFTRSTFLLSVNPDDYPRVVIRCRAPGRAGAFTVAGEGCLTDPSFERRGRTFFLDREDMTRLMDTLFTGGFFRQPSLTPPAEDAAMPERFIAMILGDRSRWIAPAGPGDETYGRMEARLCDLLDRNRWQFLFPGGSRRPWWAARYPFRKGAWDEGKKTACVLEDLASALPVLPDAILLEVMEALEKRRNLADCLTTSEAVNLLAGLDTRLTLDPVVRSLVRLLTTTGNKDLLDPTARYLFSRFGERCFPVLGEALRAFHAVKESLKSDRWYLRAAAVPVAVEEGPPVLPALEPLLSDEHPEVRRAAVRSVAALGGERARALLTGIMEGDDAEAKQVVVEAVETLNVSWAPEILRRALAGDAPELWKVALQAVPRHAPPETAAHILAFVKRFDPDAAPARMGIEALVRMGGAPARSALLELLRTCRKDDLSRRLALALAWLGETRAFPFLEECLLEREHREEALRAMAFLLVADYGGRYDEYKARWNANRDKPQSWFLKKALGVPLSVPSGRTAFEGIPPAVLVGALENEAWPVRMAALRILEDGTGLSFGALTPTSAPEAVRTVAEGWRAWLAKGQ